MGHPAGACSLTLLALALATGCVQNPLAINPQTQTLQQQQLALQQRYNELSVRATALDRDNQEQSTLLAQEQQLRRVAQDQVSALKEQLGGAVEQLTRAKEDQVATARSAETQSASLRRRGGAAFAPNSSLASQLPAVQIPGVEVRLDGDVIRIELPGARLFEPGGARLTQQATSLIQSVAGELGRLYPDQLIGVEGHTDSDPIASRSWTNNHQLSIGRAMAVYDQLISGRRLRPGQLFVVGHGANHPVVSNGTPAGKERNRRVELVIYPEKAGAS